MSIISNLSNPEGLYIYKSASGLNFITSNLYAVCDPDNFQQFVEMYRNGGYEELKWKNFSIKENEKLKILLTIYETEFEMWLVTWMYIVNSILKEK